MSTLKVANVHFDSAGTNRINYLDDNALRFHTNGTERLRLDPTGNLTIGRTDSTIGAGVKLDINGGINASSILINGAALSAADVTARVTANAAFLHANAAFDKANSGGSIPITSDTRNTTTYLVFESKTSGGFANANVSTSLTFNPSTGTLSSTVFNSTSDESFKYDITAVTNALAYVDSMNGVRFKWKNNDEPSLGVIAQDIEKILPELVKSDGEHKSVNYNGIIAVLIEAIKELRLEVEDLKYKYRTEVENK